MKTLLVNKLTEQKKHIQNLQASNRRQGFQLRPDNRDDILIIPKSKKQAFKHTQKVYKRLEYLEFIINKKKSYNGFIKNNGVFRVQHKLSRDDIYDTTKEDKRYSERMPKSEYYEEWTSISLKRKQVPIRYMNKEPSRLEQIKRRSADSRLHKSVRIKSSEESIEEMETYQESDCSGSSDEHSACFIERLEYLDQSFIDTTDQSVKQ
ncbi:6761_t:CDS:2, partial [Cetraspora pellucida]